MRPRRDESLARDWYARLTPIEKMRTDAMAELRREWSVADGVIYGEPKGIPVDGCRVFKIALPPPPVPVFPLGKMLTPSDLCIETRTVEPQRYVLPDGRDLFIAGRCAETAAIYSRNVDPPIDYVGLGPDLLWMLNLWDRCGRHVAPIIEAVARAVSA